MDFILDNLFMILLVLVILFVIGFVIRSLKFVLFIGIIILILGFFGFLGDGFNEKAKTTFDNASSYTQQTAVPMIKESLATAEFTYDKATGAYVIGAEKFQVRGTQGSNKGELVIGKTTTALDVSFLSDFVRESIEKSNGAAN